MHPSAPIRVASHRSQVLVRQAKLSSAVPACGSGGRGWLQRLIAFALPRGAGAGKPHAGMCAGARSSSRSCRSLRARSRRCRQSAWAGADGLPRGGGSRFQPVGHAVGLTISIRVGEQHQPDRGVGEVAAAGLKPVTAWATGTMKMPLKLPSESRSSSPEMTRSARAARAQASTASSSASRDTCASRRVRVTRLRVRGSGSGLSCLSKSRVCAHQERSSR